MVGCGEETSGDPAPSLVDVGDDITPSDATPTDGDGGPQDDATTGDLGPETTGDAAVEDTADASEPAGPILIEAEVTWAGWSMTIRETPAPFALVTSAGTVLQDSEGALSIIDAAGFEASLEAETSPIHAGVRLGESGSLFAGDEGLLGFVEGATVSAADSAETSRSSARRAPLVAAPTTVVAFPVDSESSGGFSPIVEMIGVGTSEDAPFVVGLGTSVGIPRTGGAGASRQRVSPTCATKILAGRGLLRPFWFGSRSRDDDPSGGAAVE